jgi:hypothetical protein
MTRENTQPYYTTFSVISCLLYVKQQRKWFKNNSSNHALCAWTIRQWKKNLVHNSWYGPCTRLMRVIDDTESENFEIITGCMLYGAYFVLLWKTKAHSTLQHITQPIKHSKITIYPIRLLGQAPSPHSTSAHFSYNITVIRNLIYVEQVAIIGCHCCQNLEFIS